VFVSRSFAFTLGRKMYVGDMKPSKGEVLSSLFLLMLLWKVRALLQQQWLLFTASHLFLRICTKKKVSIPALQSKHGSVINAFLPIDLGNYLSCLCLELILADK